MVIQSEVKTTEQDLLRVVGLSKIYDGTVKAVEDVAFSVQKGEVFALLGGSGCGKSTLLRMLAGFETPTQGNIFLAGKDITSLPPYQRPINMMFQSYALFPHLTVWDNIAFGLRRDGMAKADIANRVESMLSLVQLNQFARRKPHQLSGGQQQRVALARSLAKRPQLLLLDEPLGALDKKLREKTQFELINIVQEVGVTCVLVTHDQEEAMTMASRIAVMGGGRFLQVGRPREIYEVPNSVQVADFVGNVNLFQGEVTAADATCITVRSAECMHAVTHSAAVRVGMRVSLALRPEKITLTQVLPLADDNWCVGEVVELAYFGAYTTYHVKLDSGMVLKVQAMNGTQTNVIAVGHRVYASWHTLAVVVLTQ
ncbi:MAG: polyamine ABC transporter ATP-binding protein [Sulfuriferula sp.]|nr:polyamine ABC transporter ATP-binding protein [Sulfuriferula sp.]